MRLLEAQEAPAVRVLTVPMRRQPCSSEHRRHRHNRRNSCATTQQLRYDATAALRRNSGATTQSVQHNNSCASAGTEYPALRAKRRATRVTDHTAYAYARMFDGVRCTSDGIALQARRFACWHGCADRSCFRLRPHHSCASLHATDRSEMPSSADCTGEATANASGPSSTHTVRTDRYLKYTCADAHSSAMQYHYCAGTARGGRAGRLIASLSLA